MSRAAATRIYSVVVDDQVVARHRHAAPAIARAEQVGGYVVGSDRCFVWSDSPTVEGTHWMDVTGARGVGATALAWLRYQAAA